MELKQQEREREAGLAESCRDAILGIGIIPVRDLRARTVVRKFNPTRPIQEDLVKKISKCLMAGDNKALSNPLVIALKSNAIDLDTLEVSYDTIRQTPDLHLVKFLDAGAKLYVLSGCHRFIAAKKAFSSLEDKITKLKETVEKVYVTQQTGGSDVEEDSDSQARAEYAMAMGDEMDALKELQGSAQIWPAWFYDYGQSRSLSIRMEKRQ